MKILLTGGSGQLSTYICHANENKYNLISLNKSEFDITNIEEIESILKKYSPKIIINTAAYTDVCEDNKKKAENINSYGPKNLAIISNKLKIKLIHISTDYVYDGMSKVPYKETDTTSPLSVYGKTKLRGELYIKRTMNEYLIFRTSWLFGKTKGNFVTNILDKSKEQKNFKIINDQVGIPTYYMDLANIILNSIEAINNNIYGIYNFSSNGEPISWYDFAKEIFYVSKKLGNDENINIKAINSSDFKKIFNSSTNRPLYSVLNSSNAKKIFNFSGNDWKKSLEITIKKLNQ